MPNAVKADASIPTKDGYTVLRDMWMPLADGTTTCYNLYIPNPNKFPGARPAIIRGHGNGRDGTFDGHQTEAIEWCDQKGYIVLLPDFRGQGRWLTRYHRGTVGSYGPWTVTQLSDINEFIKLCKSMRECNGKVAVYGNSQGGLAATMAAAWSGQPFPEYAYSQGWYKRTENFQTITCAVSINWSANPKEVVVPGGNAIGSKFEEALLSPQPDSWRNSLRGTAQGTRWDKRVYDRFKAWVQTNDFASLKAELENANGNQGGVIATMATKLAATTVPIMFRWAIDDTWRPWQTSYSDLLAMGDDAFVHLSPGGHNSDYAGVETTKQNVGYDAWLDYNLTGDTTNIAALGGTSWDDKDEMRMAVWPDTEAERTSGSYTWGEKWVIDKGNFSGFSKTSVYLRDDGSLSTTAETLATSSTDITQNWNDTDFDDADWADMMESWANGGTNPLTVLFGGGTPKLVVGEMNPRLAALGSNNVIAGTPTATIFASANKPNFIIEVALIDYNPSTGDEVFITHGWKKVTGYDHVTGDVVEYSFDLGPCCHQLDSTDQLQFRIATYPIDEFFRPGNTDQYLHTRPIFGTDGEVTLTIQHNSTQQSKVAAPLFSVAKTHLDS